MRPSAHWTTRAAQHFGFDRRVSADSYDDLQYVSAALHHERATEGSHPARMQRHFPSPQSCFVGRGHDCLCIGLEEIRRLGSEFDYEWHARDGGPGVMIY